MIVKPNDISVRMNEKDAKTFIQGVALAGLEHLRNDLLAIGYKPSPEDTIGCVVTSDLNGWYYKVGSRYLELVMDTDIQYPTYVEVLDKAKMDLIDKYMADAAKTDNLSKLPSLFGAQQKKNDLPN